MVGEIAEAEKVEGVEKTAYRLRSEMAELGVREAESAY